MVIYELKATGSIWGIPPFGVCQLAAFKCRMQHRAHALFNISILHRNLGKRHRTPGPLRDSGLQTQGGLSRYFAPPKESELADYPQNRHFAHRAPPHHEHLIGGPPPATGRTNALMYQLLICLLA